jgi:hypothetical protein
MGPLAFVKFPVQDKGVGYKLAPSAKPFEKYECGRKPLSPKTWKELRLDEYIKTYPRGLVVNLTVSSQST